MVSQVTYTLFEIFDRLTRFDTQTNSQAGRQTFSHENVDFPNIITRFDCIYKSDQPPKYADSSKNPGLVYSRPVYRAE